eukprot:augustus_masked-scaffold_8-processed-gene-7.12-mRNA-1 protein AED:0.01 eAED:0.01 QI:0/-1/0/1/-1/1/1/0/402
MSTVGKNILCQAAVCWKYGSDLEVVDIEVTPPQENEVRIRIIATSLCQSDESLRVGKLKGFDLPIILGHEAAGIIESVGKGVDKFSVGDTVLTWFMNNCYECDRCNNKDLDTNICIKAALKKPGLLVDTDTPRSYHKQKDGTRVGLYQYLAAGTFAEYTVMNVGSLAKINPKADLNSIVPISCGFGTGYGSSINCAKVREGSVCAVWGLGTVGLACVEGCIAQRARKIYIIDLNPRKFSTAFNFIENSVRTHKAMQPEIVALNPKDVNVVKEIRKQHPRGIEFSFDCIGLPKVFESAYKVTTDGIGQTILVGLPPSNEKLCFPGLPLIYGRIIKGAAYGGWKGAKIMPKLVEDTLSGRLDVKKYVTHQYQFNQHNLLKAFDLLSKGESLRTVLKFEKSIHRL